MADTVVVGGGIAGILAALCCAERGERVHLVERNEHLGGLLRSRHEENGASFDYGTHFVTRSGCEGADALLFDEMTRNAQDWNAIEVLAAANFVRGTLNPESPCVSTLALPEPEYANGLRQLLHESADAPDATSLGQELHAHVGSGFASSLFEPALRKLYGRPLEELAPGSDRLFMLRRLIALTPELTKVLKQQPHWDARLAFHSRSEGANPLTAYYPKVGGIGRWVSSLRQTLVERGVTVHSGCGITGFELEQDKIVRAELASGGTLDCERVLWTIPVFQLLRACSLPMPSSKPPELRATLLFHYCFDKPLREGLHYVTNYDPDYRAFRVTLYDNAQSPAGDFYRATVEVLTRDADELNTLSPTLVKELKTMGLLPADATVLQQIAERVPEGFPVMTNDFVQGMTAQRELARPLSNVMLLGKARGTAFFMTDVLRETYELLS